MNVFTYDTTLFPGELLERARQIRHAYPLSAYDHRPFLPAGIHASYREEKFRIGYACFKREVAHALQPRLILEIGVGLGISALAFMDGCPSAYYLGIDNDSEYNRDFPIRPSEFVSKHLHAKNYSFTIHQQDSKFPLKRGAFTADLVHVDADHSRAATKNDVLLAWNALTANGYVLIDDSRDSSVAAGVFDAIAEVQPGSIDWTYFEDTWTGSILIHKARMRP